MRQSGRIVGPARRKSSTMILNGHGLSRFRPMPKNDRHKPKIVCHKNGR